MTDTTTTEPLLKKTMLELPAEVTAAFAGLDTESRDAYAAALRGAKWTLQSIAAASGLTRERVRQVVKAVYESNGVGDDPRLVGLPLPFPPAKPVKVPRTFVEPDPDKLARLLVLKPVVSRTRAATTGSPEVVEYNRLVNEVVTADGVPIYRLALRLGVSSSAIQSRLVRYRFKESEGTSKAYTLVGSGSSAPVSADTGNPAV